MTHAMCMANGVERATANAGVAPRRRSDRVFVGMAAVLFAASVALTIAWCGSMAAMRGTRMLGGWAMSMPWTRMPGQSWPVAAASFAGMWLTMMVAMMLPSQIPMLWRYRQAVRGSGDSRVGRLTALVGMAYFFVWTLLGIALYPLGAALAAVELEVPTVARVAPTMVGVVVLAAGAVQLTAWKAHQLGCCRVAPGPGRAVRADCGTALRHGLRLGLHCSYCCANLTAILLVLGVMDLRAMAIVTAAITAERLVPDGAGVARGIGMVALGAGALLVARAIGLA